MGARAMIDKRHVVQLQGRDYVMWAGVLDLAHQSGLQSIEVNLIQFPAPENGNLAIAQATATFEGGRVFTEIGDASVASVGRNIAPHICRMAATRAKGRALRDALNLGETMLEELGPDTETAPRNAPAARTGPAQGGQRAKHDSEDEAAQKGVCTVCGVEVTPAVAQAALKKFHKVVCIEHGREIVDAMRAVAEEAIVGADG
jgi:hypothetical protein